MQFSIQKFNFFFVCFIPMKIRLKSWMELKFHYYHGFQQKYANIWNTVYLTSKNYCTTCKVKKEIECWFKLRASKPKLQKQQQSNNFSFSIGRCQNDLLDGFFHALATATQLFQITKIRQKLHKKICEIDWPNLCLQQFDKF